jgi:hypothetical protein
MIQDSLPADYQIQSRIKGLRISVFAFAQGLPQAIFSH